MAGVTSFRKTLPFDEVLTAAPLVWINGFPGSGKLTAARILVQLLGHEEMILIDNHQLIDPVETQFPRDHPDYQRKRQLQRNIAFTEYVANATTCSQIIVFTGKMTLVVYSIPYFQSDNELGRSVAMEYEAAARKSGRHFLPIHLICDVDENLRRVSSVDRAKSGTKKLTSCEVLKDIRSRCELFSFGTPDCFRIRVTHLLPIDVATKILAHIRSGHQSNEPGLR